MKASLSSYSNTQLFLRSYPRVDNGTAPRDLPHALPAPWPGHTCMKAGQSFILLREAYIPFAPASVLPSRLAASSRRAGRPLSPTQLTPPVQMHRGSALPPARSFSTKELL